MGKIPTTKKDSFFIGKNKKNSESPSKQRFAKKSHAVDKQVSSSSGSFLIKPSKKSQSSESKTPDKPKKTFDKKKWRLQKYSKKYKLEQWEERQKKNLLNEYYKQVEDEPKFDVKKIYEKYGDNEDEYNLDSLGPSKSSPENDVLSYSSVASTSNQNVRSKSAVKAKTRKHIHEEYQRKQEEKKLKKEEAERKRAEKDIAIKAYKQKKLEKYKKLNKKTKKGQPIMKYRMEMLLEQIQKAVQ